MPILDLGNIMKGIATNFLKKEKFLYVSPISLLNVKHQQVMPWQSHQQM